MNKTTITLNSATIYQLEAGEHKAIVDNGDVYVCVQSIEGVSGGTTEKQPEATKQQEEAPAPSRGTTAPARGTTAKAEAPANDENVQLTEDEMMDMGVDELTRLCKSYGIDPSKFEGKNTNKKLRLLILDYYDGKLDGGSEEEEEAPRGRASRGGATAEVVDDTPAPSARPSRASRGAKSDEPEEIPVSEWDNLKPDDMVLVKLDLEDEEQSKKLWEAQIVGWDTPKGLDEEKLYVLFSEDGQEDYLRDGDILFKFKKQL